MSNDIIIDYINGTTPVLGGEGEDMGTGTSNDYEIPGNTKTEEIGAESDIIAVPKKPADTKDQKDTKKPATPPPANNKPEEKPKAVMPPPKKPGGN